MKILLLQIYWRITRAWLRFHGAEVGKNVRCNGFPYVKIRKGGRLIISDHVQINASRWANAHIVNGGMNLYVGMDAELLIGARTGMSGTRIVAMNHIEIGEDCMIGAGCLICDSDMHEIPLLSGNPVRFKPIHIGDKVFIGANSILLKGVSIGEQSIIGAGAVVTKPIPEGMIAIGNPASVIQPSLRNPITS